MKLILELSYISKSDIGLPCLSSRQNQKKNIAKDFCLSYYKAFNLHELIITLFYINANNEEIAVNYNDIYGDGDTNNNNSNR